jgi:hypothetical protein
MVHSPDVLRFAIFLVFPSIAAPGLGVAFDKKALDDTFPHLFGPCRG